MYTIYEMYEVFLSSLIIKRIRHLILLLNPYNRIDPYHYLINLLTITSINTSHCKPFAWIPFCSSPSPLLLLLSLLLKNTWDNKNPLMKKYVSTDSVPLLIICEGRYIPIRQDHVLLSAIINHVMITYFRQNFRQCSRSVALSSTETLKIYTMLSTTKWSKGALFGV